MCGILFCLQQAAQGESDAAWNDVFQRLQAANAARGQSRDSPSEQYFLPFDRSSGPDAQETVVKNTGDVSITFFASELRLRGDAYIAQPHRDEQGNVLCWNGEVCHTLPSCVVLRL